MPKVICCVCGRQIVSYPANDKHCIDSVGAKAGFSKNECFCRECGKDLDENGNFPEEAICQK